MHMLLLRRFAFGLISVVMVGAMCGADQRETGFAVTVRFDLDAKGNINNPEVISSDEPLLDPYAIIMLRLSSWDAKVLPAQGEPARRSQTTLQFAVDTYEGNEPLPDGATMPEPVKRIPPRYPYGCRRIDLSGGVLLALTIDTNGNVAKCRAITSAHDSFSYEAIKAFKKWKFKPATLDGMPIMCTVNIAVPFQLVGRQCGWRWVMAPAPALKPYMVESEM